MLIEDFVSKISDSLQELGKIFDQIHKMPLKLREKYFESIQKVKDRLINLKTNAKETNLLATQKQYKQVYLSLHSLRQEVGEQLHQLQSKENRDPNRPSLKQARKNYDDAMKLIVQKDEKIAELNQTLVEKEGLIALAFDDLRRQKKESQQMAQQYRITKNTLNHLEIQYSSLKSIFIKAQENSLDLQLKDQQRERCFRETFSQIQTLRSQLVAAEERLLYFQQLVEVSMRKTKAVEENIRMVQLEASTLNQKYRRQQGESLKRQKEIEDLTMQLNERSTNNIEQEIQIDQLKQQLHLLEFELDKLQTFMYEERALSNEERNSKDQEIAHYADLIQNYKQQNESFRSKILQLQAKNSQLQCEIQQKSKQIRRLTEQLSDEKVKVQDYLLMTLTLQGQQEQTKNNLQQYQSQQHVREEQLQKSIQLSKQLQNDIRSYQGRLKVKEEEIKSMNTQILHGHEQILIYKHQAQERLIQIANLQKEFTQLKASMITLQDALRQRDRDIESLRRRFVRAKIEIIHEIRENFE